MPGPPMADTIVALSSGRPPAAIAIVRTSGPDALTAAERVAGALPAARQAVLRQLCNPSDGSVIDQAILLRFDAPNSATGEDIVEYQCHGGRATVDALIGALIAQPGIRLAEPGEFTRRALANGRIDLTEAEGLADLLTAETELQRRSAMARAGGALRRRLDDWRERLLALAAQAEVSIDYADEEDGAGHHDLRQPAQKLAAEMQALLEAPRIEPLRDGVRVAVAGPPNAGKSSLVNALAQSEKAIVTDIPGTTRDLIEVPIAIDGIPFILVDTAGLRESDDVVEAIGIGRARDEALNADLVLWLDTEQPPERSGVIAVASKSDLGHANLGLPVSVVTGEGLRELVQRMSELAHEFLPQGDELALDRRQHDLLSDARAALSRASAVEDVVLAAEELRVARSAIDRISGRAGVDDLLDALFGRFCLGK